MSKSAKQKANIIDIKNAGQLQKLVEATVTCEFRLDSNIIRLPVHRMTADTAEAVRALRREALPPFKKDRNAYDDYDPAYLEKVAVCEKKARSFMIYCHCPAISSDKPGLTDKDAIHAHVKKFFTDNILEMIALTIQAGGMERIEDRVDFTSPQGSES